MPVVLIEAVAVLVRPLAWLGRQGTRAVAALVLFGIAIPPLGEKLRPFVTEAIFLLLCISFMRVDLSALRAYLRRPAIVLAASAWTMIAVPAMIGMLWIATGLDRNSPDLYLALMLQAVASPMMAAPALAALMGLDSTLALITLVTGTALVPLTAPLFAWMFFGSALTLNLEPTTLFHHLTYRLISVSLTAAGIYLLARWAPRAEIRPIYTVAGTVLLTVLAYQEAPTPWIPVAWISLALVLAFPTIA